MTALFRMFVDNKVEERQRWQWYWFDTIENNFYIKRKYFFNWRQKENQQDFFSIPTQKQIH